MEIRSYLIARALRDPAWCRKVSGGFCKNPPSTVEVTGLTAYSAGKKEFIVDEEKMSTENQTTEEAPPASKSAFSDDAIAAISEQRRLKQSAIVEAAELRGQVKGMQEATVKAAPPAVSPLDAEIARQAAEGIAEDEMTISPTIYRKHEVWKDRVTNQKAAADAKAAKAEIMESSRTASRAKHADWNEVTIAGEGHLTAGEMLDLENAGMDFGDQAYEKCKAAIERAKPKTETPAPEKKPGEPENKAETEKKEPLTQQEILDAVGAVDPDTEAAMKL